MEMTRRRYLISASTAAVSLTGCLGGSDRTNEVETSYECDLAKREPVSDLPQPVEGPSDAAVTVDVFSDFACPHCATFATGGLTQLKNEYLDSGDVRFRHFDFPIPVSEEWSYHVANVARSIQDTHGDTAFFEFTRDAYQNQGDYSWQLLGDLVDDVGTDPCRALSDASNATYEAVLSGNRETGIERGVKSTPGIFVNGTLIETSENGGWYGPVASEIDASL